MTIKMKSVFTILFPLIALVQIPVINCANIMKITPTDVDSGLSDSLFNLCLKLQDSHVNVNDNKTIRNNFVVSPLGFGLALGQISLGANTQLRNHIYDFMQWNSAYPNAIHNKFNDILNKNVPTEPKNDGSFLINIKSAFFYREKYSLKDSFLNGIQSYYQSEAVPLPIGRDFTTSQRYIDNWVSKNTNNLIQQFPISQRTVAVVANVVLFNGDWEEPFATDFTRTGLFYNTPTDSVNVTYVMGQVDAKYGENNELNVKVVRLPYVTTNNRNVAMYVILPKSHNLKSVLSKLTPTTFNNLIQNLRDSDVDVKMPKLNMNHKISIRSYLERHNSNSTSKGLNFTLTEAIDNDRFFLTDVVQETVLKISEKGTTAASVSGGVINYSNFSKSFLVTQPYIFVIRDDDQNVILYWGTIYNPNV